MALCQGQKQKTQCFTSLQEVRVRASSHSSKSQDVSLLSPDYAFKDRKGQETGFSKDELVKMIRAGNDYKA
ncbi:hypothetical protein BCY86_04000 [Pajaroellobacter abortibovis]|uniref:Uncharacterized protein n=1 Tax=Pajaroellobacter abortibovis TaxID=1882918 RepID=A0A1L6MWX5_9BACT|nr:hypothetical protein BCY86_04000 [Pajaroellobacter abortibovis]